MDIYNCTKNDLLKMEYFYNNKDFNNVVILPNGKIHESSGYECMDFILCNGREIVGKTGKNLFDVAYINGIFGAGEVYKENKQIEPLAWKIDCIPKLHLLRIFCSNKALKFPECKWFDKLDHFDILVKEEQNEKMYKLCIFF